MPPKTKNKGNSQQSLNSLDDEGLKCLEVFKKFDLNGDGTISQDELCEVLQKVDPAHWDVSKVKALMKVADMDKNGVLSAEEFVQWLMQSCSDWDEAREMAQLSRERSSLAHDALIKDNRKMAHKSCLIEVHLVTAKGTQLGIKLDNSNPNALTIKSIQPGGLFGQWNDEHRMRQVTPGDTIVSVNDLTVVKEMITELRTFGEMDVHIQPHQDSVSYTISLCDRYDIGEHPIDTGHHAVIKSAKLKSTGESVAIRSIHKSSASSDTLEREISIMKELDHPNIIRLFDVYEDFLQCHLVIQLCTGGELFEKVLHDRNFSESDGARVSQQLLAAVLYMHQKCISHRDIKPENLLIEEKCDLSKCTLKMIDWQHARTFQPGLREFRTLCGSPDFAAPEIRMDRYNHRCDLWSCGCITYFILGGYPPFCGENEKETIQLVRTGALHFDTEDWRHVSEDGKDFITKLLVVNPDDRHTAEQATRHSWLVNYGATVRVTPLHDEYGRMKSYQNYSHFKKQVLHSIAHRLTGSELQELRNAFSMFDTNKDGTITFSEFKEGLEKIGRIDKLADLREILEGIDTNGNKRLDFSEFIAATLNCKQYETEDVLWEAFHVFDHDHSGRICPDELAKVLANGELDGMLEKNGTVDKSRVQQVMKECDADGDGEINFHEFVAMMRGESLSQFDL